jgi:hypothetical protein
MCRADPYWRHPGRYLGIDRNSGRSSGLLTISRPKVRLVAGTRGRLRLGWQTASAVLWDPTEILRIRFFVSPVVQQLIELASQSPPAKTRIQCYAPDLRITREMVHLGLITIKLRSTEFTRVVVLATEGPSRCRTLNKCQPLTRAVSNRCARVVSGSATSDGRRLRDSRAA